MAPTPGLEVVETCWLMCSQWEEPVIRRKGEKKEGQKVTKDLYTAEADRGLDRTTIRLTTHCTAETNMIL